MTQHNSKGKRRRNAALELQNSGALEKTHSFGSHACVQRQPMEAQAAPAEGASIAKVLNTSGNPLHPVTRAQMEPHFGQDFSGVRIHTDAAAESSARGLSADAYTVNNHVAFAPGKYAPQTEPGQRLLAHELTHVVQQGPTGGNGSNHQPVFEVSQPSDPAERVADQVAAGQLLPTQTSLMGSLAGQSRAMRLVQRDAAKGATKEAPAPAERQIPASEAWLFAENRLITEIQTRYEELVRLAAFETKDQVEDFFSPYSDDLSADAPFSTFLNITAGSAGNVPNDPASIQPLQPGSSPTTPHGPIPPTFSVSGGIAGGLAAGIGPLVSLILDASAVGDVRKNLDKNVNKYLNEELTTSSETYNSFEAQARSEMQQYFLSNWADSDRRHDATGVSQLVNETALHARQSYGISSTVAAQLRQTVAAYVKKQLDLIQPVMDGLEKQHRNRRYGAFALGAGLAGALFGGALGLGLGGGKGLAIGAGLGLLGGGLLGLAGAGLTNLLTPTAADIRKKRDKEKDEAERKRQEELRKNDILDPRYRQPGRSQFG